jgi:small-conductance mechanosensitive channel
MALVYIICLLLGAFLLFWTLLFIGRRLASHNKLWSAFVTELRIPLLLILLEIATVFSISLLDLGPRATDIVNHAINILIIGTIGWFIIGIIRACYRNFVEKHASSISTDLSCRSLYTQFLFLYRLSLFIVLAVTLGIILLTFPYIKSVGLGILGSAGIAGLALGIAARPILLNLMVGFQIAFNKIIKIGDAIFIEGEMARIENIRMTHVVACTWDLRRIVVPISYFIDKPFQNWDLSGTELIASVFIYCDYTVPIEKLRKVAEELITNHPSWNKEKWNLHVTNLTEKSMEIRITATTYDSSSAFELKAYIREKLIGFIQKENPTALPCIRNRMIE